MKKLYTALSNNYSKILRLTKLELNKINRGFIEPCYKPPVHLILNQIIKLSGMTEGEIKDDVDPVIEKYKSRHKVATNINNLICVILIKITKDKGNPNDMKVFAYLLGMRLFSIALHKYIKYCYPITYDFAMSKLKNTHLFIREGSIPGAILYITNATTSRRYVYFTQSNLEGFILYIQEIWHRINQSTKSFSKAYYSAYEDSLIKTIEPEYDDTSRLIKILINQIIVNYSFTIEEDIINKISKELLLNKTKISNIIKEIFKFKRTSIESSYFHILKNEEEFLKIKDYDDAKMYADKLLKLRNQKSLRNILWDAINSSPSFEPYKKTSLTTQRYVLRAVNYYLVMLAYKVKKIYDPKNVTNVNF